MVRRVGQQLAQDLAQRHRSRGRGVLEAAPLDADEPEQQRAALEYAVVIEVQDRARQLTVIPPLLRCGGDEAAAQLLDGRRSGGIGRRRHGPDYVRDVQTMSRDGPGTCPGVQEVARSGQARASRCPTSCGNVFAS